MQLCGKQKAGLESPKQPPGGARHNLIGSLGQRPLGSAVPRGSWIMEALFLVFRARPGRAPLAGVSKRGGLAPHREYAHALGP